MNNHEAPDRCPECDDDSWSDVPFRIDGVDSRMCHTCGRIERRCGSGHWVDCETPLRAGRCATCTPPVGRPDNPIAAARYQLCHALGRLDAMRKYPESCPTTLGNLLPIIEELETTLRHIQEAAHGS
jgi:hypothetical protein